jgi:hypothetical protein
MPLRLAWVHEVVAVAVVGEEVAVVAEVHLAQDALHLRLRRLVVAAAAVDMLDRGQAELHIVAQFGALGGEHALLEQRRFAARQFARLHADQRGDGEDGGDQRQDGEDDDLVLEAHGGSFPGALAGRSGAL